MNEKCIICEAPNLKSFMQGKILLNHCHNCDITYNTVIPEAGELDSYYKSEYIISASEELASEKRRIFRIPEQTILISELMKYKKPPAKILDYGCDKGYFLDEARRYGYQVNGLEPSNSARVYLNKTGIPVTNSIDGFNESPFDIITFWHVLEHFANPIVFLTDTCKILKDDGLIFIRVPAYDSFWSKLLKDKWIWFQPKNHYFHYSAKSLRFVLERSGYNVIFMEHRKPNNRLTKRMYKLMNSLFLFAFETRSGFKSKLKRIYEDTTGIEIFAVCTKKVN